MDEYPVYLNKPWINYSTNVFSGWTITVTADTGGYVITALALLVQVAGEAMWTVAAFTIHQFRASDMPQTGLFRQTQVILRNPSTTLATSFQLIQVGWKWHGVVDKAIRKAAALASWPVLLFVGFITAGIFVSRVTKPAYGINQVLLRSTNCGLQNWKISTSEVAYYQIATKWASDIRQSRAYASECYDKPNKTLGCATLPAQQLQYTTEMNVLCPLGRRCMGIAQFDTGLLDSHRHLGINAKHSDRVNFQMRTTCAPIDITDTYRTVPDPFAIEPWFLLQTYLGPYSIFNYTYSYPTMDTVRAMPYTLWPVRKMASASAKEGDTWAPIPDFLLNNADLTLGIVAFNNIAYSRRSYDPIFSANGTYMVNNGTVQLILPDHWISTIACTDQLRVCNPNGSQKCSPLTGAYLTQPLELGFNGKQGATAERIIEARLHSTIYDVIYQQDANALLASEVVIDLNSPGLPNDQWLLEANKWFQTALAKFQMRIVDFPTNEWDGDALSIIRPDQWPNFPVAMTNLCNQQLVRSTNEFQPFSMSGILIVLVVSIAILITSWTLESCVFRWQSRQQGRPKRYKRVAYAGDGKLQLLRMVLYSAGHHGWQDEFEETPYRVPRGRHQDIHPVVEQHGSVCQPPQARRMHSLSTQVERPGSHGDISYRPHRHHQHSDVWPESSRRPSLGHYSHGRSISADESRPLIQYR